MGQANDQISGIVVVAQRTRSELYRQCLCARVVEFDTVGTLERDI